MAVIIRDGVAVDVPDEDIKGAPVVDAPAPGKTDEAETLIVALRDAGYLADDRAQIILDHLR